MKKFLFALMAIAVAFASCQKDDNDGGNDNGGNGNEGGGNGSDTEQTVALEDLTSGVLVINSEQTLLTGIFVDEYSGYMMVTMTDVAGAESFDWLVENEAEYVQILVLPSLCNREFDVMTETDGFALYSTYASAPLFEGAGPGFTEAIESGSCRFDFDGTNAEAFINLKLADGSTIAVRGAGVFEGTKPEENYIERNGDKDALRAAFYSVEDGLGYFYFTPADIDYFEEIEMASYYVVLLVDESLIDGRTVDIATESSYFEVYYVDNATGDMIIGAAGDTAGVEGTFSISRLDSEASFAASASIAFSENISVSLTFSGECTDMYAEPAKENAFVFDDVKTPIASVVVDTTSELWNIWLSGESGVETVEGMQSADALRITAPEEAFSGEPVGLSTYKTIEFAYGDSVWNYDNGAFGTLTVSLDGETLNLDFTNYENLNGYYSGPAVVIK
ncbi:hypothetical protein [uncultured Alistipes sp.]|uniref:hypothetical protein n=1 Tax=uncultured Alistipes sp. TaxID=538949 RepID=UPI0028065A90|nr:hypothetical protein [uncultured Alistipes sp.]